MKRLSSGFAPPNIHPPRHICLYSQTALPKLDGQQSVVKRIGTQPSAISRIEDADDDGHSPALFEQLANALDMLLLVDFAPHHPKRGKAKGS